MTETDSPPEKPKRSPRRRRRADKAQSRNGSGRKPNHDTSGGDSDGPKRGFYLLPNLLTSASLFCGFWAITESFMGDYVTSAWLLLVAMIFDGLDGKVARLTGTSSAFGIQYDSMADLVSFGVAPGFIAYTWALRSAWNPKIGWTMATMFVICGALRLARFNIQFDPGEKTYMKGLAIPAAAAGIAVTILFFSKMGWVTPEGTAAAPNVVLVMVILLSFLMISRIKYYSFKDVDVFRKRPLSILLLVLLVILIIRVEPQYSLFFLFLIYMFSGPARFLFNWYFRRPGESGETLID